MKTKEQKEQKDKKQKVQVEQKRSKYAGKPLHSAKEESAKKFEGTAMDILKQFGLVK